MGLSLNPSDVAQLIARLEERKIESLADYIESIATSASNLAEIWAKAVQYIQYENAFTLAEHPDLMQKLDKRDRYDMLRQAPAYFELAAFYDLAAETLAHSPRFDLQRNVVSYLGSIVRQRNITKELYQGYMTAVKHPYFFDKTVTQEAFNDLTQSVLALQKEAAALRVLSKTIRSFGSRPRKSRKAFVLAAVLAFFVILGSIIAWYVLYH